MQKKFSLFLKSKGLKPTSERLTILEEALATDGHFEADDLLVILKQKGRKTSRATIYRTLELLAQAGLLRRVWFGGAAVHFEKIADRPRIDYMICRECGNRFGFRLPELPDLQEKVCAEIDFKLMDYNFQIFGLCSLCSRSKR
jgi:Fur family ferric uptake transcriptional regulator